MLHNKFLPGGFLRGTFGGPLEFAPSLGATPTTTTQTVTVTDSADPVITGADAFNYTVQYTNTGSINATSVSVAITVDSSLAITGQSGTGWSFSVTGQVVTATQGSIAPGAANPITINVTTGTSALTATTSAQATANNATTANGSQNTTVQLVSRDASAGIYFPASSTEFSNFAARKGLSISAPDAIWNLQEASGNPADANGSFPLTAAGTGLSYQNAVTGYSRRAINFTDGSTGTLSSTSASLSDISTASMTTLLVANITATGASTRGVLAHGTTMDRIRADSTGPRMDVLSNNTAANGSGSPLNTVQPYSLVTDRTGTGCFGTRNAEKLSPTFDATVTGKRVAIGNPGGLSPSMQALYGLHWNSAQTAANLKALVQAMGYPQAWS